MRFTLNDDQKADVQALKKVPGVLEFINKELVFFVRGNKN
nr:hypothetical protein [Paenibacillus polymyxa]